MTLHHASCIEYKGKGILILGESGAGKSDLAIRLLDAGGTLVSDDYVEIINENNLIIAKTAPNIGGMIEVRGVGLMNVDFLEEMKLDLALELLAPNLIDRLPEDLYFEEGNAKIPFYKFDGFCSSAIAKINLIMDKLE